MTFLQKHDQLITLTIDAWNKFSELDKEIFSTNGPADFNLIFKCQKAYSEWQQASNDANSFLIHFKESGKKPQDEM